MKKVLWSLLLTFIFVSVSFAQSTFKPKFQRNPWDTYIGIKGGAMYSFLTGVKNKPKITGLGGLFVEAFLTKHFSIQQELMFVQQGVTYFRPMNELPSHKSKLRLNYIYTDFLLKQYIGEYFNLYSGLHIGRIIYAKIDEKEAKNDLKEGDFTIPVGVSFVWKDISLDARYNIPIAKISEKKETKNILGKAKNTGFMLTLGYRIQIL